MFPFLIFLVVLFVISMAIVDRLRLPEPLPAEKTRRHKVVDFFIGILLLICNVMWFGGLLFLVSANFFTSSGFWFAAKSFCFVVWIILVGVYLKRMKKNYILAGMITGIVAPFLLFGFCMFMINI